MRTAVACLFFAAVLGAAGLAAAQTSPPPAAPPQPPDGALAPSAAPEAPPAAAAPPAAVPPAAVPPAAVPPAAVPPAAPPIEAPPIEAPPAPPYAAPPPPGPPPVYQASQLTMVPGVHTHDGFFARVQLGVASTTFRIDGIPGSFSQTNAALNIQIGGALTPHVILFGELFGNTDGSKFDAPGSPAATPGNDKSGATFGGIGVGSAYCFMPQNVCLAGTLATTSVTPTGVLAMGRTQRTQTNSAGAIKLGVTKEWWVGGDWGLGVAVQYLASGAMHDTEPYANIDNPVWHAQAFSLLASFTYN
jgi:hypothetical protein